ncbi:unnamed protein product [Gordionus sp. m RMFG-2023]|uniref:uncharacterized protein LOC135923723 n=1 Tax=Gordionus sp. m RMFG-2023 TaxID=3053472 RepID=UPI0030DF0491
MTFFNFPLQDHFLEFISFLSEEDKDDFIYFNTWRNNNRLGCGIIIDSIEKSNNSKCDKCNQPLSLDNEKQEKIVATFVPALIDDTSFSPDQSSPNESLIIPLFYHQRCFSCVECKASLSYLSIFYFDDRLNLYCGRHFAELYKPRCESCDQLIFSTEAIKTKGGFFWHLQHFSCSSCYTSLYQGDQLTGYNLSNNTNSDLKDTRLLLCQNCHETENYITNKKIPMTEPCNIYESIRDLRDKNIANLGKKFEGLVLDYYDSESLSNHSDLINSYQTRHFIADTTKFGNECDNHHCSDYYNRIKGSGDSYASHIDAKYSMDNPLLESVNDNNIEDSDESGSVDLKTVTVHDIDDSSCTSSIDQIIDDKDISKIKKGKGRHKHVTSKSICSTCSSGSSISDFRDYCQFSSSYFMPSISQKSDDMMINLYRANFKTSLKEETAEISGKLESNNRFVESKNRRNFFLRLLPKKRKKITNDSNTFFSKANDNIELSSSYTYSCPLDLSADVISSTLTSPETKFGLESIAEIDEELYRAKASLKTTDEYDKNVRFNSENYNNYLKDLDSAKNTLDTCKIS